MAILRIGGKDIEVPPLNFKAIKKIWPLVEKMSNSEDNENLVELVDLASEIISIALERSDRPLTVEEIEEQLLGFELPGIQTGVEDLLIESGLMQRTVGGEVAVGEPQAESHSTEIGTASSQNSSPPDAAEPTGTE